MSLINVISVTPAAAGPSQAPRTTVLIGSATTIIPGRSIGEGVHAKVVEGLDTRTLTKVALKKADLRKLRRNRKIGAAQREWETMSSLNHPNIVKMLDAVRTEKDELTFVLERCNLSVSELSAHMEEAQVANIVVQTLQGLAHMHAHGVAHRDIKPENLLVMASGTVKIADFGESEFLAHDDIVTRTSGTPAYQAPEIARGDESYSGTKVDIWALGVTAYSLLSGGRMPFNGDHILHLYKQIRKGDYEPLVGVSAECHDLVNKMLTTSYAD